MTEGIEAGGTSPDFKYFRGRNPVPRAMARHLGFCEGSGNARVRWRTLRLPNPPRNPSDAPSHVSARERIWNQG